MTAFILKWSVNIHLIFTSLYGAAAVFLESGSGTLILSSAPPHGSVGSVTANIDVMSQQNINNSSLSLHNRQPTKPQTILDTTQNHTRNPKRPGRGFTKQELGAATIITKKTQKKSQIAYLTSFREVFSQERSLALLDSILNDVSPIESMQIAVTIQEKMQQKLKAFEIPLMRYEKARQIVKESLNKIVKRYTEVSERTAARQDAAFYKLPCDRDDYQKIISRSLTYLQTFYPTKIDTWTENFLDASEDESKSLKERVATAMRNIGDNEISQLWSEGIIIVSDNPATSNTSQSSRSIFTTDSDPTFAPGSGPLRFSIRQPEDGIWVRTIIVGSGFL